MKHAYIKICPLLILAFFGSCLMARLGQYFFFFGAGHELSTPQLLLLLLALFMAHRYLCFAAGGSPFRVCLQNRKRSALVLILPTPKAQISFLLLLPGCCKSCWHIFNQVKELCIAKGIALKIFEIRKYSPAAYL